jgi:hypothetical protein
LTELRRREPAKERKADYQGAAIDRLHAVAYRLAEAGRSRCVGLQPTAPEPASPAPKASGQRREIAAKAPQGALPLGPVIVRAGKPRPR